MKRFLVAAWRVIRPVRQPIQARLDSFVIGCMGRALERMPAAHIPSHDVNLALDSILAEIHRLQLQVEELHNAVEAGAPRRHNASLYESDAA